MVDITTKNQEWTASDRAQCVAQDFILRQRLTEEVQQSNYVTSSGYKAVLLKFLYSEAVESELTRSPSPSDCGKRPRSSRFRNLVSRMPPSLATANPFTRRLSINLDSSQNSSEDGGWSTEDLGNSFFSISSTINSYGNIAPRRSSPPDVGDISKNSISVPPDGKPIRRSSSASIELGDIQEQSQSITKSRSMSRFNILTEVDFDPQDTEISGTDLLDKIIDRLPSEHRLTSEDHTFMPWPKQDDGNVSDEHSIKSRRSSCFDDLGWLPWPETGYAQESLNSI